jgi:hypothetical protein
MNTAQAAPYVLFGLLLAFTLLVALIVHLSDHDERGE